MQLNSFTIVPAILFMAISGSNTSTSAGYVKQVSFNTKAQMQQRCDGISGIYTEHTNGSYTCGYTSGSGGERRVECSTDGKCLFLIFGQEDDGAQRITLK